MESKSGFGTMLKEAGILFAITLLSGLLLGFFYELTKEPIAEQERRAIQEACEAVFPDAVFEMTEYSPSPELMEELSAEGVIPGTVYMARAAGGDPRGYVIQSIDKRGYGGRIELYVGISLDGVLSGVSVLEISETPGLGMRAEEVLSPQFEGRKAEYFVYSKTGAAAGNEIDAIAGATITTRAYLGAVNGALKVAQELGVQGVSQ